MSVRQQQSRPPRADSEPGEGLEMRLTLPCTLAVYLNLGASELHPVLLELLHCRILTHD